MNPSIEPQPKKTLPLPYKPYDRRRLRRLSRSLPYRPHVDTTHLYLVFFRWWLCIFGLLNHVVNRAA